MWLQMVLVYFISCLRSRQPGSAFVVCRGAGGAARAVARFWNVLGRWGRGDVALSLMRAAGTTYQQRFGWEGTSQPIPCAMGSDISHHISSSKPRPA